MIIEQRIAHIQQMEGVLNTSEALIKELYEVLERWEAHQSALKQLIAYYESEQWMEDYDASNEGQLPKDMPQGVLSEDAVYNVIADVENLKETFAECSKYEI